MKKLGKWGLNIAIGFDQFINAVFGGDPDETISSRLGKTKVKHGGKIPWRHPLRKVIDWGLDKIDKDHCVDAIEEDEGKDSIIE